MALTYPIVFEKIAEGEGEKGHYYAHIPVLGLTTHGQGVEGARAAVLDLLQLWLAEKQAVGEPVQQPGD
jgi:predicted RNase H-like HicB family nuclease